MHSEDTKTKISDSMKKVFDKKSEAEVDAIAARARQSIIDNARTYIVESPSGETTMIKNLKEFCRNNQLDPSQMSKVTKGKISNHKGWICRCVENGEITQVDKPPRTKNKEWKVIDPAGVVYKVKVLKHFCEQHNISYTAMKSIGEGTRKTTYKGWTLTADTPDFSGVKTKFLAELAEQEAVKDAEQESRRLARFIQDHSGIVRECIEFSIDLKIDGSVCYIYRLTNIVNNKKYIGVSHNPIERFMDHAKPCNDAPVGRAIRKYGKEYFDKEIIFVGDIETCFEQEEIFIKENNSQIHSGHGYNVALGGMGTRVGTKLSEETKAKISAASKGKKRGPKSAETRAKISAGNKGKKKRPMSEEGKLIRSIANKGRVFSEEHKRKIGEKTKQRMNTPEAKEAFAKLQRGKTVSKETRNKLSIINKKRCEEFGGRSKMQEECEKIRKAKLGKKINLLTRKYYDPNNIDDINHPNRNPDQ